MTTLDTNHGFSCSAGPSSVTLKRDDRFIRNQFVSVPWPHWGPRLARMESPFTPYASPHCTPVLSYMALMINGFISMSVWTKCCVLLRHPRGASLPKESCQAPPPTSWRVLLGPLNLALQTRAERQLDATSSQGGAAVGRLQKTTRPLEPLTVPGH